MGAPTIFWEDFREGEELPLGPYTLSEAEIVEFARQWDPQPMHLDAGAAAETFLGELTASGWQTCCILMRMICDAFLLDSSSMGAPGIEEVRWVRPVRPGDVLNGRVTVLETRPSSSRPEMGIVRARYELANQHGEAVLIAVFPALFGRRAAEDVG